ADRHEMTHAAEPIGNAGALLGDLFENPGSAVADDVVITLHLYPGGFASADPLRRRSRTPHAPLRSRSAGRACGAPSPAEVRSLLYSAFRTGEGSSRCAA